MTASITTVGIFVLILLALVIGIPVVIATLGGVLAEVRDRLSDRWRKKHDDKNP
jgi:hypothetical protein